MGLQSIPKRSLLQPAFLTGLEGLSLEAVPGLYFSNSGHSLLWPHSCLLEWLQAFELAFLLYLGRPSPMSCAFMILSSVPFLLEATLTSR